jgi:hypothetical protein
MNMKKKRMKMKCAEMKNSINSISYRVVRQRFASGDVAEGLYRPLGLEKIERDDSISMMSHLPGAGINMGGGWCV